MQTPSKKIWNKHLQEVAFVVCTTNVSHSPSKKDYDNHALAEITIKRGQNSLMQQCNYLSWWVVDDQFMQSP